MKKLIIAGFVGNDAEVKDLPSGTQVINFNLAVTEKVKDEYKTTWFKCARFTNNVAIAPYLKKGTYLIVEGRPDVETYVNAQGTTVANLKCIVDNIHFGGNKSESPTPTNEIPQANQPNSFADEKYSGKKEFAEPLNKENEPDDLPF